MFPCWYAYVCVTRKTCLSASGRQNAILYIGHFWGLMVFSTLITCVLLMKSIQRLTMMSWVTRQKTFIHIQSQVFVILSLSCGMKATCHVKKPPTDAIAVNQWLLKGSKIQKNTEHDSGTGRGQANSKQNIRGETTSEIGTKSKHRVIRQRLKAWYHHKH